MATLVTLGHGFPDRSANGGRMFPVEMIECRVCGAGNRSVREGCFNCGSLLRVDWAEVKERTLWVSEDLVPIHARLAARDTSEIA